MENIIEIEDLTFAYENNLIFNNLNINIKTNSITTILGPNGSGKTTLLKLILAKLKANTFVMIENTPVIKENFSLVEKDIQYILEITLPQEQTVKNFLTKTNKEINKITEELNLTQILTKKIKTLSEEEKHLVAITQKILTEPKIIILDSILDNLQETQKQKIIKIIKDKNITLINATNNIEDSLYSTQIILINKSAPIITSTPKQVLENEELLANYNLKQPFIIELSNKLKFYNLITTTYFNEEKLVDDLWK